MEGLRAVLVDIDGVLTVSWRALPGAVDALARLRRAGLRVALLTNTTSRTRAQIVSALADAGFAVEPSEVLTAPVLTASYLAEHHPGARCLMLNSGEVAEDLAGVAMVGDDAEPDVVVLGGAGPEFTYEALNRVFAAVLAGAPLVAMHRNLFWRTRAGLQLDTGAYLTGLEQAAGVSATVVGKPSPAFFTSALDRLDVQATEAIMVGDDIDNDVLGAQAQGISGILVRTGKYRAESVDAAAGTPDTVLDSFADVPNLLGLGPT